MQAVLVAFDVGLQEQQTMEDELKCTVCKRIYTNPVLLPCMHSLCFNCGLQLQQPAQQVLTGNEDAQTVISEGSSGYETSGDSPNVDTLSIVSETDSGVVINSRPNSYVGTPNIHGMIFPPLPANSLAVTCPVCSKTVYFDENGVQNLSKSRALQNIIDRYRESKNLVVKCQLCEGDPKDATVLCEQCEILYCDVCKDNCHPARGPLASHTLINPNQGRDKIRAKNKIRDIRCSEHVDEQLSMYCMLCKVAVCYICLQDGRHSNHDVQALGAMGKAQKTELSQTLQALSEKLKAGTEFLTRLKSLPEKVQENCKTFEKGIISDCDLIIAAVERRKEELIKHVREERDFKIRTLKEQVTECSHRIAHTTGLLQFCIEALKEPDSGAFLQIGNGLINRVANVDLTWHKDVPSTPRVPAEFDLTLDLKSVINLIDSLDFLQMKLPGPPAIIPEECSAENNSVTIAWQPHLQSYVEGHVLEIDDGSQGPFRVVYCGKETICTIDGLHFHSMYNARVKSYNAAGEGRYSECIALQTADVAWFTMDATDAHPDLVFSNDNQVVTCNSYDDRVVLGNIGFSKGVHYWEVTIDRYDNHPDPAFGIARFDVTKDAMLGKDDKGWSMYIDSKRSWFIHNNQHTERTEGGINKGSVIGVLLDLDRHTLMFYVNDEPHGPVAFTDLHGVFYPAVSLNRNVTLTIHTGLDLPTDTEGSEGSSGINQ